MDGGGVSFDDDDDAIYEGSATGMVYIHKHAIKQQ